MDRLSTIFDGMFDGVWLVDVKGATTYVNEAIAAMLGTTRAAMHGRPITEFLPDEFRAVATALIDRQSDRGSDRVDLRFIRSNGDDLWTLVAASPISNADGTFVGSMLNVSDVTGKRAAQVQALQNQKLEAVGGFAAGISHDFNNLLTAIRGFAELAAYDAPEGGTIRADLEQVIVSADQARRITNKLLAFTRRQILTPIPVDPGRIIVDMLPILRTLLSGEVEIVHDPGTGSMILADPVALEQIFINFAVNAHDAMPTGGQLRIAVDDLDGHGREALGADAPRAASVRIRVEDTGIGMDEATIARIFDPFYTTKPMGKGTGLGLSTVYGLIRQMNGEITVESVPGKGTTFSLILPLLQPGSPGSDGRVEGPDGGPVSRTDDGPGVILMVEDDDGVREFGRRVLAGAGHTVLTAVSGPEAIETSARWSGEIDVLLSDVVMPDMRGPVAAAEVRRRRPDIAVIYMSGYAEETLPGIDGSAQHASFLAKPFTGLALLDVVATRLAVRRAERRRSPGTGTVEPPGTAGGRAD